MKYFEQCFPRRFSNSNDLISAIRSAGKKFDIIHITNLWNLITTRAARTAGHLGVPYALSPRGMLSAWSRGLSRLDKELYYILVDRRTIHKAALVHFLTQEEAQASRVFLNRMIGKVIPNGIWLEDFNNVKPDSFRESFGLQRNRLVVFLGRLHAIKRLDIQCRAFELLAGKYQDLRWVFVGPDDGASKQLKETLNRAGLQDRVTLTGMLSGRERLSALVAADVYCQTSDHEGHSVAITEALAAGKPCVVTRGCNFNEIETANAGLVVSSSPESVAEAIEKIILDPELAIAMGQNAKALVAKKYTWNAIGKKMVAAYKSALGH